ncbi:hypothetical protein RCJ22_01610, partial [Vibrio sp. FNV 38]|nr:hypothetical protein [Vibrio sp. FNV 38]
EPGYGQRFADLACNVQRRDSAPQGRLVRNPLASSALRQPPWLGCRVPSEMIRRELLLALECERSRPQAWS